MRSQDFTDFVASQQEKISSAPKAQSETLLNEWLQSLDDLYKEILKYLDQFLKQKSISYRFRQITLHEDALGRYKARAIDISIGKQLVTFEPVGTKMIGNRGRVDVIGLAGQRQLIYVNKEATSAKDLFRVPVALGKTLLSSPKKKHPVTYAWKILSRDRDATFVDLNRDSLYALLMEVAGGG